MKCTIKEVEQEFKPFELTFTVESLKEARAWHRLFNYYDLLEAIGLKGADVHDLLSKQCPAVYDKHDHSEFIERIRKL